MKKLKMDQSESESEALLPSLSPKPLSILFKDITYEISGKEEGTKIEILKGISGYVEKCKFLTIMGPVGSGKTSLLDVLAGRRKKGKVTGKIWLNGYPLYNSLELKKYTGYVFQDELFLSNLTVRETIDFSFRLRVGIENVERRENAVTKIIQVLGLTKIADTQIGNSSSIKISNGERKRLEIGCELVTSPGLLFIEEPTTGNFFFSFLFFSFLIILFLKSFRIHNFSFVDFHVDF